MGSVVKRQAGEGNSWNGSDPKRQKKNAQETTAVAAGSGAAGGHSGLAEGAAGSGVEARPRARSPTAAASTPRAADGDGGGRGPDEAGPVRLFLGGLPGDAAASELRSLLGAFGDVLSVDIIPPKDDAWAPPTAPGSDAQCRGFAYVSLQPKSAKELRRCLSLVSCMCMPNALRVEELRGCCKVLHNVMKVCCQCHCGRLIGAANLLTVAM